MATCCKVEADAKMQNWLILRFQKIFGN